MKCRKCGKDNNEENLYCVKCGGKLKNTSKIKVIVSISIVAIIMISLVVGYFVLYKEPMNSNNVNSTNNITANNNEDTIQGTYTSQIYDKNSDDSRKYKFSNGKVEAHLGLGTYIGTYTYDNDNVYITYTDKLNLGESQPLDIRKETFRIISKNKLVTIPNGQAYIKQREDTQQPVKIPTSYVGKWSVDTTNNNTIEIYQITEEYISFGLFINRICQIDNILATIKNENIATFTTNDDAGYEGIYGTIEFEDNKIIVDITCSYYQYIYSGEQYTYMYHEDTSQEKLVHLQVTDRTGINGTYYSAGDWKGNASNYSYTIQSNQIEYNDDAGAITRQGTFTQEGNKLYVTYNKQSNWSGDITELEIQNEELTIEDGKILSNQFEYEKY